MRNILISLIFSLASTSTCYAEVVETVENRYYTISPRSPYDIKQQLKRYTPIREARGSFNGRTDWVIKWRYETRQSSDTGLVQCEIYNMKTDLSIIHILPALSEQVKDQRTIDVFNQFSNALTQHELNHGEHGRKAAHEIDQAFANHTYQQDCINVSSMVTNKANLIIQKYSQMDAEYDRTTMNGLTEGAVLPR